MVRSKALGRSRSAVRAVRPPERVPRRSVALGVGADAAEAVKALRFGMTGARRCRVPIEESAAGPNTLGREQVAELDEL